MDLKKLATTLFAFGLIHFVPTDGQISTWTLNNSPTENGADRDYSSTPLSQAETSNTNAVLFTVTATAINTLDSYAVEMPIGKFVIGGTTGAGAGEVTLAPGQMLDYESGTTSITIKIAAVDNNSGTKQTGTATVLLMVTDVVETAPVFNPYSALVVLDQPVSATSLVFMVAATDAQDDTLTFSISGGDTDDDFLIQPPSGEIYTANSLDGASYLRKLTVACADESVPPKTSTTKVTIRICDNLDCCSGTGSASLSLGTLFAALMASLYKLF